MTNEPAGAAEMLAAFERAASEADSISALSEGFAIALRSHGHGVLSEETRLAISGALRQSEAACQPHLPEHFAAERLYMGVESLCMLLIAWAEPVGVRTRSEDVEVPRLIVRIVANDLDSICARLEIERGGKSRPPLAEVLSTPSHVIH
ncbi:hypothetical protein MKK55_15225 [Methylobacterium sp. J-059]|uniref:hypothetical protein n=1 Tax=Methylobacterium sp. J-059 TaxID=2836643 RepID=UPI001FB9C0C0|nr:hypothetical protein [Methylobacterium sp. J-059]MCJ2040283.1 hypothetical protein [Methylobacterium sp. J-059]